MKKVNMKDAFEFAMNLERKGQRFFKHCAKNAKRDEVQKMFRYLAAEESQHIKTLKKLFNKADKAGSPPMADEKTKLLLDAYAGAFFPAEAEVGKKNLKRLNAFEAIGFGIRIERNAIDYYTKIRSIVPEDDRSALDLIIDEEKSHYERFRELQNKIKEMGDQK